MMDRRSGSNNSYRDYFTVDMDTDDGDSEFEEKDPSGRYGRYKDILGRGAFKTVYKAFDELEGMEVAWNQIKIHDAMKGIEDLERLYSEVHLLKTLKHQNIIKFYNSWIDTTNDNVNFITEIFTSGTLRQYRKKHRNVDMRAVKNWSRQILRGLVYLHSHDPPIIHRDLKCDNIFVNGNQGQVKIGDLGLAAILRKTNAAHSIIGTPEFMAPELYEEEYNELVDVYSFGMCLLEMVTLEYPYSECANAAQIFKKVTAGKKPAALDQVKDPVVREFVEKCLASVSERLSANQLLVDPFLQCEGIECVPYSHINEVQYGFDKSFASEESSIEEATKVETCSKISSATLLEPSLKNEDSESATLLEPSLKNEDSESFTEDEEFPWEKSNRDFAVKGHKKNENTAFLSLQIVDPEGHVRNIHFPFDITIDTATTVAREMVTELDLSDEDVTNIATMIDAEMQELVPDWKPGVPQDNIVHEETNANYDVYEFENDVPKLFENSSSQKNGYKLERLPSGRHFWSDSPTKMFNTTKKKKNIDSSRNNLRHAKSEDMSFEFVFSSSDHQENNNHHQDTVNKLDIVKETPANQERSYMHGSTQVFRKSQSCSEIDKMSSDNMSFEDMEIGCSSHKDSEMPKHGSLLVEDLKEESHSQQSLFSQRLADMSINHLSVTNIEIRDGLLAYLQERFGQGVARKFENLVLKQQQELEGLKKRHERDLQNFMEELSHNGEDNGNNRQLNGNLKNGCTSEMIKKGSYGESDNGSESTKLNGHHNTGSRAA